MNRIRTHARRGLPGLLIALSFSATAISATEALAPGRAAGDPSPTAHVLRSVDRSAQTVTAVWRGAALQGLMSAAARQGIVLCEEPVSDTECAGDTLRDAPELRWSINPSVTFKNVLALIRVPVTMEIFTQADVDLPAPGLFLVEDNLILAGDDHGDERETLLAGRVREALSHDEAVEQWFASVAAISELAMPVEEVASLAREEPVRSELVPDPPPSPEEAREWQQAEEEILGLVLDDRFAEARRRADQLLANDALHEDLRRRLVHLRDTAAQREKSATMAPSSEPAGDREQEKPQAPFDYTFSVRMAEPGHGFLNGTDGRLRFFAGGIRFVPSGEDAGTGWLVRWTEIQAWGDAEGLWDIGHPLVLTTRSGTDVFFAQVDDNGRFTSGRAILSILARGAERFSGSRASRHGEPATGDHR